MKAVIGNKIEELSKENLVNKSKSFDKLHIDIGTGNGRYVFEEALRNKNTLFIGIDPVKKQLEKYSKKANRKKLDNVLFIIGSIELMPFEIKNFADSISVLFPWGTLLENVVKPTEEFALKIKNLLKDGGSINIIFGYEKELESKEIQRLNLPEINEEYINKKMLLVFEKNGLVTEENINPTITNTSWMKKLRGKRKYFQIYLRK